jgi:hypothetical protein
LFWNRTIFSHSMYLVLEQNLVAFLLYIHVVCVSKDISCGLMVWLGKKLGWDWVNNRYWYRGIAETRKI